MVRCCGSIFTESVRKRGSVAVGLSASEKKLLEKLTKKAEEPDAGPVSKSVRVNVDLSDPKSVALAIKHGFLDPDEEDDDDDGDKDDKDDKDETPKRRGYFADGDKK
jgi:hypothetical protein